MAPFASHLGPQADGPSAWVAWFHSRREVWLRITGGDAARARELAYMEAVAACCQRQRVGEDKARVELRSIGIEPANKERRT